MDTFFFYLKKSLVATTFLMFALVATYTPQDWNRVETVEAQRATLWAQLVQDANLVLILGQSTISAIQNTITAIATNSLWIKEYFLDGIAWTVAKLIISKMINSLINWINSGFEGSPMFVQDLEGFLRNAADEAIGEYIQELGGPLSFLCDPFQLDIQVALALQYQQDRIYQPAPKCTLTEALGNIKDFTSGSLGSFSEGGWEAWFDITSQPSVYTPYGSLMAAQGGANMRVLTAKGEETTKMNWGNGFLSGEICEMVQGAGIAKEECFISKPGKVIVESLNSNLNAGMQSLITADEIDELIGALFSQLANKALTGTAGLLGLSGGTGYSYNQDGLTYIDAVVDEQIDQNASSSVRQP